jgi:hypothetical protein
MIRVNRMSALDVSRYCPAAGRLSEQYGAGVAAAVGRAFHARIAKDPTWEDMVARLPDAQRSEVLALYAPPDVLSIPVGYGTVNVPMADAEHELEVTIDVGDLVPVQCVGHLDLAWHVDDLAVVVDLKRTRWACPEGPASLQLQAYGLAYALRHECSLYVPAIWDCTEGELLPGKVTKVEEGPFGAIESAALNTEGEAVTGDHCRHCYARMHCPEYILPGALATTTLGPAATGAIQSNEDALRCLRVKESMDDLSKVVEKNLKVWCERNGGIVDEKAGKVWRPTTTNGRLGFSKEAAIADGVDVDKYMVRGKAFDTYRWTKLKA